jgi:virulence-associated protein VagC
MATKTKIFRNGGSRAVRLPKAARFPEGQREALVHRVRRRVILEPADEWNDQFRSALGAWLEATERPSRKVAKLKDPFA